MSAKLTKQQKRDLKRNAQKPHQTNIKEVSENIVKAPNTSVYRRDCLLPTPYIRDTCPLDRFVVPDDKEYEDVISCSYSKFIRVPPEHFPSDYHEQNCAALRALDQLGLYLFDMTQPAGLNTKVAKTFVTRCLLGDCGITYKYLGIRMFAHPWNSGAIGAIDEFVQIGRMNEILVGESELLLKDHCRDGPYGNCKYNLALINRCFPEDQINLKDEPMFKREKCSVSWHADSTLEHFSSIAVYHCTFPPDASAKSPSTAASTVPASSSLSSTESSEENWRIALRVLPNAEGPLAGKQKGNNTEAGEVGKDPLSLAPPVAVPLPDRWSYFMLDDFNHHHQHSVLPGKLDRISSTHRVCRTDGHTFWSIKARCVSALQGSGMGAKQLRAEQLALNEVEFEWIRQFYIQGARHQQQHVWWKEPMNELLQLWGRLEARVAVTVTALKDAAVGLDFDATTDSTRISSSHSNNEGDSNKAAAQDRRLEKKLAKRRKRAEQVEMASYDAVRDGLEERHLKRAGWKNREKDPAFKSVPKDCRPLRIPFPAVGLSHCPTDEEAEEEVLKTPSAGACVSTSGPGAAVLVRDVSCEESQAQLKTLISEIEDWKAKFAKNGGTIQLSNTTNKIGRAGDKPGFQLQSFEKLDDDLKAQKIRSPGATAALAHPSVCITSKVPQCDASIMSQAAKTLADVDRKKSNAQVKTRTSVLSTANNKTPPTVSGSNQRSKTTGYNPRVSEEPQSLTARHDRESLGAGTWQDSVKGPSKMHKSGKSAAPHSSTASTASVANETRVGKKSKRTDDKREVHSADDISFKSSSRKKLEKQEEDKEKKEKRKFAGLHENDGRLAPGGHKESKTPPTGGNFKKKRRSCDTLQQH